MQRRRSPKRRCWREAGPDLQRQPGIARTACLSVSILAERAGYRRMHTDAMPVFTQSNLITLCAHEHLYKIAVQGKDPHRG